MIIYGKRQFLMPLAETCNQYLCRSLFVLPYYGNGWSRADSGPRPPPNMLAALGPEPFHVRIEEWISCAGQLMGASGTIEEPEHPFDKHWCAFYLRQVADFNFSTNPGDDMIWITPTKAEVNARPEKAIYEWVFFDKSSPCHCGFGTVAEKVEYIGDTYGRTIASRKLVAESQR